MLLAEVTSDTVGTLVLFVVFVAIVGWLVGTGILEARRQNAIIDLVSRARKSKDKEAGLLVDTLKTWDTAIFHTERDLRYASAVERYDLETALAESRQQWDEVREKLEKRVSEVSQGSRLRVVA